MKINKSDPLHWFYLAIFTANTCMALIFRLIVRPSKQHTAILYGHKLNGNLKSIYDYALQTPHDTTLFFLTIDPAYYHLLKQQQKQVLSGLNPIHMLKVATAPVVVSDHGLHSLILFLKFSNMKFVDVWHGLPFKGFDKNDFITQQQYNEIWVSSEKMKELYINQYSFPPEIVKVTGYARTDILINKNKDANTIKKSLGILDHTKKIILFAPTWQQDQQNRNIYPFGIEEADFLHQLNNFCQAQNVICILRKHLNTKIQSQENYEHIYYCPYQQFPDAEEILLISDILICDWSSIAFDYLLLSRPTLFLDVEPPFKKGFSLDASYRFGKIINDISEMLDTLAVYLEKPDQYLSLYAEKHQTIKKILYDNWADGKSSERCLKRLLDLQRD